MIIQGDALTKLKELDEKSINMCMTSPPYWALRDYGTEVETIWDGCNHIWFNEMQHDGKGNEIILDEICIKCKARKSKPCEHKWGEGIIGAGSRTNDSNSDSFQKESLGSINRDKRPDTHFCNKCNAWKGSLGLEPSFDLYIKHLCNIFDEVKRVLRDDGTCWVVIGDTYYGGGGSSGHTEETKNLGYKTKSMGAVAHNWQRPSRDEYAKGTIKKNCLICNKEFYGKENSQFCSKECLNRKGNDFRSQNRLLPDKCLIMIPMRFAIEMVNRGWILRNVIIWHKPNCMPSSAKDRFTVDFEYIFFFSKKKKYYFETQYEPIKKESLKRVERGLNQTYAPMRAVNIQNCERMGERWCNEKGRNKRTVWKINPKPFRESHFAVYPEELCETPIKAGCPEGGTVLDPFFGAGTTGLVALKQNKKFIGIELNPEYIEIAKKRLKPYLEQEKLI